MNKSTGVQSGGSDDLLTRTYELGLKWMKCEDYKRALELFAKAIKVCRTYSIETLESLRETAGLTKRCAHDQTKAYHPLYAKLLDSRISCLIKIGNIDKALKEAQYFCKIEPMNTRALLRLAKTYELKNNYDKARIIYKRAKVVVAELKAKGARVVPSHENIIEERLTDLANEEATVSSKEIILPTTKRVKRPENSISTERADIEIKKSKKPIGDPIVSLPVELLANVMSYLSTKEILACTRVCRAWYQKISCTPSIIDEIPLNKTNHSKIRYFLEFVDNKQCINRRIKTVNLSILQTSEEEKCVRLFFSDCKAFIQKMVIKLANYDLLDLFKLIAQHRNISANICELSVFGTYIPHLYQHKDMQLLAKCRSLKKLEIILWNNQNQTHNIISSFTPNGSSFEHITALDSIKLIFKDTVWNGEQPFGFLFFFNSTSFVNIKKIVLTNGNFTSLNSVLWLQNFPQLTNLWLERNRSFSLSSFLAALMEAKIFHKLRHLTIRECLSDSNRNLVPDIPGDEQMKNILANLENLQTFDIMNCSIGRTLLYNIVSGLPEIRRLNIGNVFEIPDNRYPRNETDTDIFLFLKNLSHLNELQLPHMTLHHDRIFRRIALVLPEIKTLEKLDLSFNPSMQGFQLYEIIREFSERTALDTLTVDGCPLISPATITDIRNKGWVRNIECNFSKSQWERFGCNSFWYR